MSFVPSLASLDTTMELRQIRNAIRRRTEERSELSRGAREVGEDLAHLPD